MTSAFALLEGRVPLVTVAVAVAAEEVAVVSSRRTKHRKVSVALADVDGYSADFKSRCHNPILGLKSGWRTPS